MGKGVEWAGTQHGMPWMHVSMQCKPGCAALVCPTCPRRSDPGPHHVFLNRADDTAPPPPPPPPPPLPQLGIAGRTGCGKSTLMLAMYRLVEPCAGRIVLDGIDVASIGLFDLRSRLALVPQVRRRTSPRVCSPGEGLPRPL